MQSFIVGLLLAGVSATSYVAFKHPLGYAKLFPFLMAALTTLFIGVTIWEVAVYVTWTNLAGFVESDVLQEAISVKDQLNPSYVWFVLTYVGIGGFLWINRKLPPFLKRMDSESSMHENGA